MGAVLGTYSNRSQYLPYFTSSDLFQPKKLKKSLII